MKLNKVFKKNVEDTNRIRQKAYELAEKRGFQPGHEWDDWFEAEKCLVESKNNPKETEFQKQEEIYNGAVPMTRKESFQ